MIIYYHVIPPTNSTMRYSRMCTVEGLILLQATSINTSGHSYGYTRTWGEEVQLQSFDKRRKGPEKILRTPVTATRTGDEFYVGNNGKPVKIPHRTSGPSDSSKFTIMHL